MPQFNFIREMISYITNQIQISPRNLFLKLRFRYPQQLPTFMDFLALVLVTPNINFQQPIQTSRVIQLIKELVLEADLFTTLLFISKICPILKSKHITITKKNALQSKFKQWVGNSSKQKINSNLLILQNVREIMAWIEKYNYLKFYLYHMNNHTLKKYQEIEVFFDQFDQQASKTFNQIQITFIKTQMLTQYQKLNTVKYIRQTVMCFFQWFKEQLKLALTDPLDNSCYLLSTDTLSRIARSEQDLAISTLIQACEYIVPFIRASSFQSLILLVDQIILAGSALNIIQVVLVVIPTFFLKAIQPKNKLNSQIFILHLEFWRQAVSRRFIDSTLLKCLNDWMQRILRIAHSTSKIKQLLQLFKIQLQNKVKNKNLQDLKCIFADKQIQKMQQIYQEIQPFHQILQKSKMSYFQPQKKHSPKQRSCNYEVSLLSSKVQLMSMLESIQNHQNQIKLNNIDPNQQQLKIYSNKNSVAQTNNEEDNTIRRINYVISMLDLVGVKPQIKKEFSIFSSKRQPIIPFLPLYSSKQNLENKIDSTEISDPYGLNIKCRQQTYQINPIFIPISQINKKKVIKNKGIIINNDKIEIGYIFQSIYGRRKITLFITFARPTRKVSILIEENSIRFTKCFSIEFQNPKLNKQFRMELDVQKVILYKVQGYEQIQRFIKPKISIKLEQIFGKQCEINQQIHLHLYNLIEWLEIPQKQQEIFNLKAQVSSSWHKVCSIIRKFKQTDINTLFPNCKLDKQRTILIKIRFLLQVIFCKIYVVLDRVKVELINSDSETLLIALLQMVCKYYKNKQ